MSLWLKIMVYIYPAISIIKLLCYRDFKNINLEVFKYHFNNPRLDDIFYIAYLNIRVFTERLINL